MQIGNIKEAIEAVDALRAYLEGLSKAIGTPPSLASSSISIGNLIGVRKVPDYVYAVLCAQQRPMTPKQVFAAAKVLGLPDEEKNYGKVVSALVYMLEKERIKKGEEGYYI